MLPRLGAGGYVVQAPSNNASTNPAKPGAQSGLRCAAQLRVSMSFFMLSPLHRRRPLYSNCTSRSGRPLGGVNHILCGVHEQRAVADKSTRRLSVFSIQHIAMYLSLIRDSVVVVYSVLQTVARRIISVLCAICATVTRILDAIY